MRHRILILSPALALLAAAGGAHARDAEIARDLAATCANCHGTEGRSVGDTESLAGEPREKLLQKLLAFRSGDKPATIMHQIARGYSVEQLELIAAYFAGAS
jgi:cytochrome c553